MRTGFSIRRRAALASAVVASISPRLAHAITIRSDVPDSEYTALAAEPQYAASGYIDVINGSSADFGSGTLVAPDWVLTAAHVVTVNEAPPADPAADVSFGQGATAIVFSTAPASVSQVVIDPAYTGNVSLGNDLALIQLSQPITNVAPALLYSSSLGSELGLTATVVGYGETGTGSTGQESSEVGTRRAMQNTIDAFGGSIVVGGSSRFPRNYNLGAYSSNILFTDFDSPNQNQASFDNIMGSSVPLPLEGSTAPGDSGGGLFVNVNGQTYLTATVDFGLSLQGGTPDGEYGEANGYTRVSTPSSISFLDSALITSNTWTPATGGTWASLVNWTGSAIPEFAQSTASFAGSITSNSTVTLDANWTVGVVTFNNTNSYTLAPGSGGILTLDNGGASAAAAITDQGGAHFISAPITLNSAAQITVVNPGDSLTLSAPITGAAGVTISGSGAATFSGSNTYSGPTAVTSGTLLVAAPQALPTNNALSVGTASTTAQVQLTPGIGMVALSSLTLASGSTVDITTNALAINYTGVSPLPSILAALLAGNNGGSWTGAGLTSSAAAADPAHFALGYADGNVDPATAAQPNQVLVMYTLAGDATLAGSVGIADLLIVAQHFGSTGNDWAQGNFVYDPAGGVGIADLLIVAQNFDQSITPPQSTAMAESLSIRGFTVSVPEPAASGLIITAAIALFPRRRRPGIPVAAIC